MARVAPEDGGDQGDGGYLDDLRLVGVGVGARGGCSGLQGERRQGRRAERHDKLVVQLDGADQELDALDQRREQPHGGQDCLVDPLEVLGELLGLPGVEADVTGGGGGGGGRD